MSERVNRSRADLMSPALVFPQTPSSFTKTIESVNVILTLHGDDVNGRPSDTGASFLPMYIRSSSLFLTIPMQTVLLL